MYHFYAQISAPQSAIGNLLTTLAALTRLSRAQVRLFANDDTWTDWSS